MNGNLEKFALPRQTRKRDLQRNPNPAAGLGSLLKMEFHAMRQPEKTVCAFGIHELTDAFVKKKLELDRKPAADRAPGFCKYNKLRTHPKAAQTRLKRMSVCSLIVKLDYGVFVVEISTKTRKPALELRPSGGML